TFPEDVDILLVGPNGKGIILMSDAGSDYAATNVTVTFDDAAPSFVPEHSRILNGTYKPTNHGGSDAFPGVPGSVQIVTSLEAFKGIPANGNWSLYIVDDANLDSGSLQGWSLNITWAEPKPQIVSLELGDQGVPTFWILGASNKTHVVEASADLQTWVPIWTNGLQEAAALISDPQVDRGPQLFYRVYRAR
ncbi:MAG: proprotein convertase P-domain-containing protein, partial [Limisphaerales bacterium]